MNKYEYIYFRVNMYVHIHLQTYIHTYIYAWCGWTACEARELAYVSIRQHTSAYVSIRQHTSAYVSIRQHTWVDGLRSRRASTLIMLCCLDSENECVTCFACFTSES
jgi:hypothetical protein